MIKQLHYNLNHKSYKNQFSTYILFSILLCSLVLNGCSFSNKESEPLSRSSFLFNTIISIQLFDTQEEAILDYAFQMCEEYEQKFSRTIETSEISQINQANGKPVTVSDDTLTLIQKGIYYSELSDGTFDITIAPLSTLWNFEDNIGTIPDENDIHSASKHVNYKTIQISQNTVTLLDPGAMIDLGGIAKGYIADQLKNYLVSEGVEHAIINLGGNILTIGGHLDGSPYQIAIQKPFAETNTPITSLSVHDKSLVSSGIYERYFELNGQIYHHILNPSTGYPYENDLYGVTIISDSSMEGDVLSTICITKGLKEGIDFIESLASQNIQADFITKDMKIHKINF